MKKQNLVMVTLALLIGAQVGCNKKPSLVGEGAKVSYAIGQSIGQNLKQQGVQLDADVVAYAVAQTLKGEKSDIAPEELAKAVAGLQKAIQENVAQDAEKNSSVAAEFLEKNKAKEGVKVAASGLQYQVLKVGTGKKPTLADMVSVNYTGTLVTGQKFDSSLDTGKPAEFPLKNVIKGWQEALQMMTEGSVMRLYIPPDLAYGTQAKQGIPPNSVLIFDVELLKVKKAK